MTEMMTRPSGAVFRPIRPDSEWPSQEALDEARRNLWEKVELHRRQGEIGQAASTVERTPEMGRQAIAAAMSERVTVDGVERPGRMVVATELS